ncbi:MAG: FG-GAP repeat protein [Kiritimatiellia bacterium]
MNKYFIFLGAILLTSVFVPAATAALLHVSDVKLTAFDGETNDEFGISVSVDGDVALVGAESDDGARGAAYVFERDISGTNSWGLVAKLTAPDAAADDWFGFSVAVAGDVALVGAYGNDDAGAGSGSAYVFERNIGGTNAWGFVCKLTASDAAASDYFGVAVAVDGDVAIVSASGDDGFQGSAYVFQRNAGGTNAWGQVAKIAAPDGTTNDYFGVSVAVAGDVALVGAEQDDDLGSAYVFERNMGGTNAWGFVRKLTASDGAADDHFGYSVSADGDAALVGAYGCNGNRGAAYVFQRNYGGTNAWGEVTKLTASDGATDDHFGWSVAVDGGTALIGAHKDDDAGSESGSAYVFERNANGPNAWGQVRKLTASDGSSGDWFGCAVSASGNNALIGAFHDDPSGIFSGSAYIMPVSIEERCFQETSKLTESDSDRFGRAVCVAERLVLIGEPWGSFNDSGAAYLYEYNNAATNAWVQRVKLTALDGSDGDNFGYSVSLGGDIAIVGARGDDDVGSDSGSAYIYERCDTGSNIWEQITKLLALDGNTNRCFGHSVAVAGDMAIVGAPGSDVPDMLNPYSGAAYVYERDAGGANGWHQLAKLIPPDGVTDDRFGYSVSIAGDVILIGAYKHNQGRGAVYVFERNAGGTNSWGQVAKLMASDAQPGEAFGYSVSVYGDVALIGAVVGYNDESVRSGTAYIFERNASGPNAWGQMAKILASDGAAMDYFGVSVSIAGDSALVGASWDDDAGDQSGSAYLFERNSGGSSAWGQVAKLTASDAAETAIFGGPVSMDGDVALIGAPSGSGAAYIFERHFPVPETVIEEMQIQGPEVVCAWTSEVPVDYTLQVSGSMDDNASWSNLPGCADLPGVDGIISVTNDFESDPQRFYRVKAVNSPIR